MKRWQKAIPFLILALFLIGWFVLLQTVNSDMLVSFIGIENSYFVVFVLAALTGGSSFTAAAVYAVLITLVQGGVPILLISIAAGLGGLVGDTIYYYFGRKTRAVITNKHHSKVRDFLEKYPRATPFFIFCYAAFVPLPDDLITISLGLGEYPYKKMIIPLLLGNYLFYVIWLSLATQAIDIVALK